MDDKTNRLDDEVVNLYKASVQGLFRYAIAIIGDRQVVEDAIQDCFLQYFTARRQGQTIQNGRAWLYRVLHNRLADARRQMTRAGRNVSIESVVNLPDRRQDTEWYVRREELLANLVELLTPRELECLQLRLEGLRYGEIARVLGIRPGTVGALLARSMKKLQKDSGLERHSVWPGFGSD